MSLEFVLVAKSRCLIGDPARNNADLSIGPGEIVPFCLNWEVLESHGRVERVYEYDERREAKPPIPENFEDMGKNELRDLLSAQGVPPHSVVGSGSKGYVVKADLVAALGALR